MRKTTLYIALLTLILSACTSPRREAMRQRLQYVADCNRADTLFSARWLPTVDSLVSYFDPSSRSWIERIFSLPFREGAGVGSNERMMAHYLQGRVHHDMGEAPQALECYQKAAEQADTTRDDCDWYQLFRIYGQMADIYDAQNMPHKELEATEKYLEYAKRAGDTLSYLRGIELQVGAYYLLNDTSNVYRITDLASLLYKEYGFQEESASVYPTAIYLRLKQGQYVKARELMDTFENHSGLFDNGEIRHGREIYYYSKGIYYEGIHLLDSAEYYYRKLLRHGFEYEGAKGLLSVYRTICNSDSVMKYSQFEEHALENFILHQQSEAISRMNALYDYTNVQRAASMEAQKSQYRKYAIYMLVMAILFVSVYSYSKYKAYRKKKEVQLHLLEREYLAAKETILKKENEIAVIKAGSSENLIKVREAEISSLREKILAFEQQRHQHIGESSTSLMETEIVKKFLSMRTGKLGTLLPSAADWMKLTNEFKHHMPLFYSRMTKDGCLSRMEMRVCMLTRLGLTNGEMANVFNMSPQSISNAKASANGKLFSDSKAKSLFANLEAI